MTTVTVGAEVHVTVQVGEQDQGQGEGQLGGTGVHASATGSAYSWERSGDTDEFVIRDLPGRRVVGGTLQLAVVACDENGTRFCRSGAVTAVDADGNRLDVRYCDVNGEADLTLTIEFHPDHIHVRSLRYETVSDHAIVSVYLFADEADGQPRPALNPTYLVQPGLSESSALSPILPTECGLDLVSWLGRGSMGPDSKFYQQWGLPTHYFAGQTRDAEPSTRGSMSEHLSDAFCWGLVDLSSGDLLFHLQRGRVSPVISYRGDLWQQLRGPGSLDLGAWFPWVVGFQLPRRDPELLPGSCEPRPDHGQDQQRTEEPHPDRLTIQHLGCAMR